MIHQFKSHIYYQNTDGNTPASLETHTNDADCSLIDDEFKFPTATAAEVLVKMDEKNWTQEVKVRLLQNNLIGWENDLAEKVFKNKSKWAECALHWHAATPGVGRNAASGWQLGVRWLFTRGERERRMRWLSSASAVGE